jgi:26S proteasome regulatory subunit N10
MEGLTEEQEIQRAIQLSMAGQDGGASGSGANKGGDFDEAMQDPDFMNSVLGSLSGVDTTDPRIQNVLHGFSSSSTNTDKDDKSKEGEGANDKKDEENK